MVSRNFTPKPPQNNKTIHKETKDRPPYTDAFLRELSGTSTCYQTRTDGCQCFLQCEAFMADRLLHTDTGFTRASCLLSMRNLMSKGSQIQYDDYFGWFLTEIIKFFSFF